MPDWQPVSVPDFCPTCGVYWECEHKLMGRAQTDGGDLTFSTSEEARRKPLPDVEYLSRQREEPPFDPNVQPVLRYIDEDEDDG